MIKKKVKKILRNVIIEQGKPGPDGDILDPKGCKSPKISSGFVTLFFGGKTTPDNIIGEFTKPKVLNGVLVTRIKFYDWKDEYMGLKPVVGGQLIERDLFNPKLITKAIITEVSLVINAADETIPTIGQHIIEEEKLKQQARDAKKSAVN